MFDSNYKEKIKDMDNLSEMDKALLNRAIDETSKNCDEWVIRPLIFDADNPDNPIISPILSGLNFKMISDSVLDILSSQAPSKDLDKQLRTEMLKNLSNGICDNVFFAIVNNIIETSTLNFNAWWNYNCNRYFPDLYNDSTYIFQTLPPNRFYDMITDQNNKYYQALDEALIRFLKCTLSFKAMDKAVNTDPEKIMQDGMYDPDYYNYLENTAINISNLIGVMYVDSITSFLFRAVSLKQKPFDETSQKYVFERILNSSNMMKNKLQDQLNATNFVHNSVEYILEDSLYDLVEKYINPSMKNILETSIHTYFYMYQDMNMAIGNREQLESK